MSLIHWGFAYTAGAARPDRDTTIVDTGTCRTVLVGMADPEDVIDVAQRMIADGVQMIELRGGFGPLWTARVLEAIDHQVPVGAVAYGPESVPGVHAIFSRWPGSGRAEPGTNSTTHSRAKGTLRHSRVYSWTSTFQS